MRWWLTKPLPYQAESNKTQVRAWMLSTVRSDQTDSCLRSNAVGFLQGELITQINTRASPPCVKTLHPAQHTGTFLLNAARGYLSAFKTCSIGRAIALAWMKYLLRRWQTERVREARASRQGTDELIVETGISTFPCRCAPPSVPRELENKEGRGKGRS